MTTSIRPILTGVELTRARDQVLAIAEALRPLTVAATPADPWVTAELTLFYTYIAQSWPTYASIAQDLVERLIDEMGDATLGVALYGGFPGMAWIYQHVTAADDDDVATTVDEALDAALANRWSGDFDLINGLVGLGIYALERRPHPSAERVLARVVDRLIDMAEETPAGLTWRTPSWRVNLTGRPEVSYDLGVAHGVPGVVALLAAAVEAGVAAARTPLQRSVSWLLSVRLPPDAGSFFTYRLDEGVTPTLSRSAWCYGDPGIVVALHHAARALGDDALAAQVHEMALSAAERAVATCGVVDAGLCHGSAGLLQLYNVLFQATGDERFKAAALRWFEHTLGLYKAGQGLAGYVSLTAVDGDVNKMEYRADGSFLTGVAGVGLALYAATSELDPGWDRLLVPRVPPGP